MDVGDEKFAGFFTTLTQDPHVVRFFDRKDHYTVHGENALFIATKFYKTLAVVKYIGGTESGLPGVTLNQSLLENVLHSLLIDGRDHVVEMYQGSGAKWTKSRSASPGKLTAFEDELFRTSENTEACVIMAVTQSKVDNIGMVGVAYCDTPSGQLGACEFADNEQFSILESIILQLGAKEIVMQKDAGDGSARLKDAADRCNVTISSRNAATFSSKSLEQDISRLLKTGDVRNHREVLDKAAASSALAGVLTFSDVMVDPSNFGRFSLSLYNCECFLRMDSAALQALNVMPQRVDVNDSFSLYGLMNRGKTALSRRLLKVWLKQPLTSEEAIRTRHDIVEAIVGDPELREALRDHHFRGMPDVEMLNRKLEKGKAGLADLCQLYRASSKLPAIAGALSNYEGPHSQLLASRYISVLEEMHNDEHLAKFEDLLEAAVDLEKIPDEYLIAPTYDSGLEELRVEKDKVEQRISEIAEEIASDLGLQMDKSIRLEWYKMSNTRTRCMRITQTEEKKVRKKLQSVKYNMLETRKDGTKFTSKPLKEAAAQLQTISKEYESRQQQLVKEVVAVAQTFCEVWETVGGILGELDLLAAFADLSVIAPTPYIRPNILPAHSNELELLGSRHPCIEAQSGVDFVKNNCSLIKGKSLFQIITGPNMGGKSTYIRQVGVIVLMAQVGCFVPCDQATISVRDCIFARVGAGDCQVRGVSTFMAEMLETAAILKGASSKSLVIIDELGRGTSTYDGFGLAWAISEYLMENIGCPTLFATHFHELTALKGSVGVSNSHVTTATTASNKLAMLYEVKQGACDESFGIHVASFAQFPPAVVELAQNKVAKLEDFSVDQQAPADREYEDACTLARELLKKFKTIQPEDLQEEGQDLLRELQKEALHSATFAALIN